MRQPIPFLGFVLGCSVWLSCGGPTDRPATPTGDISSRIGELLDRYRDLGRFSGAFAVSVDGELLFARGCGEADRATGTAISPETKLDLASLTKQFTAAAILKLEAEGKLRVEDRIADHLPAYPRPQAEKITLHHLLSHTSGIPSLWRLGDGLEHLEASAEPIALGDLLALFQDRDLLFEPGERYRYSNSGYVVLAAVVESVSGKTFAHYLRQDLFLPLGMDDSGCHDPAELAVPYFGYPPEVERARPEDPSWSLGDGCAHSTVLDLVRWDAALRHGRLLPREQGDRLFAPQTEVRPSLHYGYGWFLSERSGRPAAHHGGDGEGVTAEMVRFLEDGLTVVALANYAPRLGVSAPRALVEQSADLYFGRPVELPPPVVDVGRAALARAAGRYGVGGGVVGVEAMDERLFIRVEGQRSESAHRTVFDYGELEDLALFDDGARAAEVLLTRALRGEFDRIPVCEALRGDLGPTELEDDWRASLGANGRLVEMTPQSSRRYGGEDTLIAVTRLRFEEGELFFALDLTPRLEVCGWYSMDRTELEVRDAQKRPSVVQLFPIGPGEFLADGFNYGENAVRVVFRPWAADRAPAEIQLIGVVRHAGVRITAE